jgi:phosphatidylglycerol:prolipoprotein diacylglycerol transferase
VIFPDLRSQICPEVSGLCARHPSQLYEAFLEGAVLLALLLFLAFFRGWLKVPGKITGLFLLGYGVGRFIVEFFRQADPQFITPDNPWGHVIEFLGTGVTMGQLLSLPMVVLGLLVIAYAEFANRRHLARG